MSNDDEPTAKVWDRSEKLAFLLMTVGVGFSVASQLLNRLLGGMQATICSVLACLCVGGIVLLVCSSKGGTAKVFGSLGLLLVPILAVVVILWLTGPRKVPLRSLNQIESQKGRVMLTSEQGISVGGQGGDSRAELVGIDLDFGESWILSLEPILFEGTGWVEVLLGGIALHFLLDETGLSLRVGDGGELDRWLGAVPGDWFQVSIVNDPDGGTQLWVGSRGILLPSLRGTTGCRVSLAAGDGAAAHLRAYEVAPR